MRNFWAGMLMVAVILCTIWIQMNVLNPIPLFGVKANLGIVLVVTLSLLCGKAIGCSIGICYGVLSDILFGKAFGIYTLLFFLVGYWGGKFSNGFSKENKTTIVLVVSAATMIFEVVSYCLLTVIYDYDFSLIALWRVIPEGAYHILLARISFHFLTVLAEILNKGKRSYYLL